MELDYGRSYVFGFVACHDSILRDTRLLDNQEWSGQKIGLNLVVSEAQLVV